MLLAIDFVIVWQETLTQLQSSCPIPKGGRQPTKARALSQGKKKTKPPHSGREGGQFRSAFPWLAHIRAEFALAANGSAVDAHLRPCLAFLKSGQSHKGRWLQQYPLKKHPKDAKKTQESQKEKP